MSDPMRIVIVGGVAGGASAAARARRLSETAEITVFERGHYISFANCGLPYHIGGDIEKRDALVLQTPESFFRRFNVDVHLRHEVIAIDRQIKQVQVKALDTGIVKEVPYDKLVLSPGAAPVVPPIPGIDNPLTHSLRNIPDMDRILSVLEKNQPQHAVVAGGGYIGLEMVEALHQRKMQVTLVELAPQVMGPVDPEIANVLHEELYRHQIDMRLGVGVAKVDYQEGQQELTVELSNGDKITTGLLIMAIGVKPEMQLAQQADLTIGPLGGIAIDSQMLTNDPDIYAVGDAVEDLDFLTNDPAMVPLAGPANRQGRMVANNIFGADDHYLNTQGTAICRVFSLAVACTGQNEKRLLQQGMAYEKIYVHAASHASYFPGAEPVTLKLLFSPDDGKILGAQAVGKDGIDKRIDVLAVAQRAGMTVEDLQHIELTYAPPYGSAKDVINQAAFVASNVLKGDVAVCHSEDIINLKPDQLVLDVRNPFELERVGRIEGAMNIPVDELRGRVGELPKDKEILVTCQVGLRGHVAYCMLKNLGFKVRNLTGGFKTYQMVTAQHEAQWDLQLYPNR